MVEIPRFETSCLQMGIKTLVTKMGQQLPPSFVVLPFSHYFQMILLGARFFCGKMMKLKSYTQGPHIQSLIKRKFNHSTYFYVPKLSWE